MGVNTKLVGAGAAVAVAGMLGYAFLTGQDESVAFHTVRRDGGFSLRDYPSLTVAETVQAGSRDVALAAGFVTLADYFYRGDMDRPAYPAVSPVLVDADADGGNWRTRFIVSDRIPADMPLPHEEGVRLRALAPRRVAAVRFSGAADEARFAEREDALRAWIEAAGIEATGPAEYALYNTPYLPGRLRHNEVLIPVAG